MYTRPKIFSFPRQSISEMNINIDINQFEHFTCTTPNLSPEQRASHTTQPWPHKMAMQ